jgi:hypothetical protein
MSVSCYLLDMPGRINLLIQDQSVSRGELRQGVPRARRNHISGGWIVLTLFLINTDGGEVKGGKRGV